MAYAAAPALHLPCLRSLSSSPTLNQARNINFLSNKLLDSSRLYKCVTIHKKNESFVSRSTTDADRIDAEEHPEAIISGEWPDNFSLLTYDDLKAHLEAEINKNKVLPSSILGDVMSTTLHTATVHQTVEEIEHHFEVVSGVLVVDDDFKCIGVVSKGDVKRASDGLKAKMGEIMSTPALTLPHQKTVLDAAALMLRKDIHRVPIVNQEGRLVGIVTRTDIFVALENRVV